MARGEVRYRLVLDSKAFTDGIKAAKNEANAMANDMSSKLGKAGSVLSAMGPAGLAAAAGIGAITAAASAAVKATIDATSQAMKYADAMSALQDKTGLSAKALQDLEVAAKLGNTSLEAISSAVNKMQRGIVDGSDNFRKLGLSLTELKRMTPEEQFIAVAKAIESIADPAQKAAARYAILGKGGNELAGALKAAAGGATELGGALSEDALKSAADLQDQADLLETAWDRVVLQFGAAVAKSPELKKGLEDITQALVAMAEIIGRLAPKIALLFDDMIRGAKLAATVVMAEMTLRGGHPLDAIDILRGGWESYAKGSVGGAGGGAPPPPPKSGGKPGSARGTGDDKAAAEAARAAERARASWQKASEDARSAWDKFYQEMREKGHDWESDLTLSVRKMAAAHAESVLKMRSDYNAMVDAQNEDAKRLDEALKQRDFARNQDMVNGLRDVASAMMDLGSVAHGVFGALVGLGGAAVQVFANLRDKSLQAASTTQKLAGAISAAASILSGPGGAKGALSGAATGAMAGAAFGGIGAVIGGVGGAILGLFGGGGPSKSEQQAAQQKQIQDTIGKMEDLMARARALKMDQLTAGVGGLAAMFGHLATKTDETGERFRRLEFFGAALFKSLKDEGLSSAEAFQQMGPALDAAIAAAQANGQELTGVLGQLAAFRELVMANEGLVGAVSGFNDLVTAVGVTKESFSQIVPEMQSFFDEMISKGFTADQAVGELAPTLFAIREAARAGRIEVDAGTQALIEQAEAGGHFDNLKDPMQELVEVQKMMLELWAAIAHMQGVTLPESLRKYIEEIHNAGNAVGSLPVPGGGGIQNKYGSEDIEPSPAGAAVGFSTPSMPRGSGPGGMSLIGVHEGESVEVRPRGGRRSGGITGSVDFGPIVLEVDGRVLGAVHIGQMRKNSGGLRSQSRRYVR